MINLILSHWKLEASQFIHFEPNKLSQPYVQQESISESINYRGLKITYRNDVQHWNAKCEVRQNFSAAERLFKIFSRPAAIKFLTVDETSILGLNATHPRLTSYI